MDWRKGRDWSGEAGGGLDAGRERGFAEGISFCRDACGFEAWEGEGYGVAGIDLSRGCGGGIYDEPGEGGAGAGESAAFKKRESAGDYYQ